MTASFVDLVDLAAERLGGAVIAANDEFFAPKENLIKSGAPVWRDGEYTERGKWMDGWETRRRRDGAIDGYDWCLLRLGAPGIVRGVDVDTAHFKGNFPDRCSIQAADVEGGTEDSMVTQAMFWPGLLPEQKQPLVQLFGHLAIRSPAPATKLVSSSAP